MNIEGHIVARGSSFVRGNAHQGGALYTWMWGTMVAQNCTFTNNTAIGASHNTGGAIFTDRGSAIIEDSTFQGNIANSSGGAIFGWSASGSCKNLTHLSMGMAETGAPCVHGIPCVCQNVTINRCSFIDNIARKHGGGGAVSNQWSQFLMSNNTCSGNVPMDVYIDGAKSTTNITGGTCKSK